MAKDNIVVIVFRLSFSNFYLTCVTLCWLGGWLGCVLGTRGVDTAMGPVPGSFSPPPSVSDNHFARVLALLGETGGGREASSGM